jgi:AhpD family alkylhydroperoxidase
MQTQARMNNPAIVNNAAMKALYALKAATRDHGVPQRTIDLIELRVSQINGCSACVDMHAKQLQKDGERDERQFALAAWREAPYFDAAERAALALAECVTRISDRPDAVPDEVWDEAARRYDEPALAALLVAIANINVWNRFNVAVRQPVGAWS